MCRLESKNKSKNLSHIIDQIFMQTQFKRFKSAKTA